MRRPSRTCRISLTLISQTTGDTSYDDDGSQLQGSYTSKSLMGYCVAVSSLADCYSVLFDCELWKGFVCPTYDAVEYSSR
jgi:hypothetical protein